MLGGLPPYVTFNLMGGGGNGNSQENLRSADVSETLHTYGSQAQDSNSKQGV